jgi:hypothetical protein
MNYSLIPLMTQKREHLAPAKISTATRAAVNLFGNFYNRFML